MKVCDILGGIVTDSGQFQFSFDKHSLSFVLSLAEFTPAGIEVKLCHQSQTRVFVYFVFVQGDPLISAVVVNVLLLFLRGCDMGCVTGGLE